MSKRGRKRAAGDREANGRLQRDSGGGAPSRVQALRAASANPCYGSRPGLAYLEGRITQEQYDQAKSVAMICADYRRAIGIRDLASPGMEQGRGGAAADPDSDRGAREAKAHARAVARYDRMMERLDLRGPAVKAATLKFCADEHCEWAEIEWAKVGLSQLAADSRGGRGNFVGQGA